MNILEPIGLKTATLRYSRHSSRSQAPNSGMPTLKISLNQKYGSAPAILKKKWGEGLSWKKKINQISGKIFQGGDK
ncbi:MAG: hypothetical protein WCP55_05840 [Lentisphaerota bacterium]